MPSFDTVSEVDLQEITNAVDQANREIGNRYDFKGSCARVEPSEDQLTLLADNEFQLEQVKDILHKKLAKRGIDLGSLEEGKLESSSHQARQILTVRQGIPKDVARQIVKLVKDSKIKVQVSIQGDKVRVSGKKRDDLQKVIAQLKEAPIDLPLQFVNFRD
ncbi:MAG TPA: YajQ family cyclic di-GMP-binding protein [Gammaproteobacteria bacterium]|nr:YajQ family cyclic di-GMP-binding protein [Gammaproteobacteria bacterium]